MSTQKTVTNLIRWKNEEDFKKRCHSNNTLTEGKDSIKTSEGSLANDQPQESVKHARRAVNLQQTPEEAGWDEVWDMCYGCGECDVEACCGYLNSCAVCLSLIMGLTKNFSKFSDKVASLQMYILLRSLQLQKEETETVAEQAVGIVTE